MATGYWLLHGTTSSNCLMCATWKTKSLRSEDIKKKRWVCRSISVLTDACLFVCKHDSSISCSPVGLQGSNAPWFMFWFRRHINCLFVCLLNFLPPFLLYFLFFLCFLSYLFTSLLVCLLNYLSTTSRIDQFCFQAGGRRRRPNLALVFWVYFML